jgi:hypothetical protein
MSPQGAKKAQPAPGEWTHQITTRPKLTMREVVGKTGTVVRGEWWDGSVGKKGAMRTRSTGMSVRFPPGHKREGQLSPAREEEVKQLASGWHADLVAGRDPGATPAPPPRSDEDPRVNLTLAEGFARYLDPDEGRYPDAGSPERKDVERALTEAQCALGGGDVVIASLVPSAAAQKMWRHVHKRFARGAGSSRPAASRGRERANRQRKSRAALRKRRQSRGSARKKDGASWAMRVVHHFFACMAWLSSRGHIPENTCVRPARWKQEFKTDWRALTDRDVDAEQDGPRFTPEEAGKLLDAVTTAAAGPRLRINMYFGGDSLRSGQVRRAMRSDLDLSACGEFGLGRLTVRGRGKKRGSTLDLDSVVRAQIDHEMSKGYLSACEKAWGSGEIPDYALMPQGRFVGGAVPVRSNGKYLRPISRRTLLDHFHALEDLAGVEHQEGRAWYGLRRLWADLGPQHLKNPRAREVLGGWVRGSNVPRVVYQSKEDELAIREASRARSAIREQLRTGSVAELTDLSTAAAEALSTCTDPEVLRHLLQLLRGDSADVGDQVV